MGRQQLIAKLGQFVCGFRVRSASRRMFGRRSFSDQREGRLKALRATRTFLCRSGSADACAAEPARAGRRSWPRGAAERFEPASPPGFGEGVDGPSARSGAARMPEKKK